MDFCIIYKCTNKTQVGSIELKSVASIYERVIYVKKIFDDILSVDGTVD